MIKIIRFPTKKQAGLLWIQMFMYKVWMVSSWVNAKNLIRSEFPRCSGSYWFDKMYNSSLN